MGNFDEAFIHELARTTWTFYSVGMVTITLRIYARIHRVGYKGLAVDDYLMVLAGTWYTILVVCLNVIAMGGGSNLFPPEQFSTFGQEEIRERILGSKIVVVSEQAMLNAIYTLKACLLVMYSRITSGTTQRSAVRYLAIYVVVGWIATEMAFFTACRPFKGYWAVPPPDPQCTTLQHYAIVQACFNISSDMAMIVIALVLVHSLKLPLKQKIMLGCVFSMGFFVIVAAILTKAFNLADVYDDTYMLWYTREASVAVYVANLPMIWPLLREWFPLLRSLSSASRPSKLPTYAPHAPAGSTHAAAGAGVRLHRLRSLRSLASLAGSQHDARADGPGREAAGFGGAGRGGSPGSDGTRATSWWGVGDIRTEVTIEIERESSEGGAGRGGEGLGCERARVVGREVWIEGGEREKAAFGTQLF